MNQPFPEPPWYDAVPVGFQYGGHHYAGAVPTRTLYANDNSAVRVQVWRTADPLTTLYGVAVIQPAADGYYPPEAAEPMPWLSLPRRLAARLAGLLLAAPECEGVKLVRRGAAGEWADAESGDAPMPPAGG